MKPKLLLTGFAMVIAGMLQAQTNAIKTPAMNSVLPPAPDAFALTRYAAVPVNMSSGSASYTLPLGEVSSGRLKLPVSLSYNGGNGIKMDQIASRTGMNWTLEAGGVVTRTVVGARDETSVVPRFPYSAPFNIDSLYNFYELASWDAYYDTQPDIFSFSFNGQSGRFILKPGTREVVHLASSLLKVETNLEEDPLKDWSIKITDTEGTEYYFGGSGATETTKTTPVNCGRDYNGYVPTAWYLKKVKRHSDQITLSYSAIEFNYQVSFSETMIRTPVSTLSQRYLLWNDSARAMINGFNGIPFEWVNCGSRDEERLCATVLSVKGVVLTGIAGVFGSATLSSTSRPDVPGDVLYSGISFAGGKTYTFSYVNSIAATTYQNPSYTDSAFLKRPFLKQVSSGDNNTYKMQYYNMNGLPPLFTRAQDYWGYFNGKSNSTLLPRAANVAHSSIFPSVMADRTPDGSKSYFGLLSSIRYPAGGRDSLIYEPNTVYGTVSIPGTPATIYITATGTGKSGLQTDSAGFDNDAAYSMLLNFQVEEGEGINDLIHQYVRYNLYDAANTLVLSQQVLVGATYSTTYTGTGGHYRLEVLAYGSASIGKAWVTYRPLPATGPGNAQVGGVRVAKAISMPITGNNVQKSYTYASLSSQLQSSGRLAQAPNTDDYYQTLPIHVGDDVFQCEYTTAYSTPARSLYFFSGGHITYSDVIETDADNWENGGIAHKYIGGDGYIPAPYLGNVMHGSPMDNFGFPAGTEVQSITFKKDSGTPGSYVHKAVQQVNTHYKMDTRYEKNIEIFAVRRKYNPLMSANPRMSFEMKPFDVVKYSLYRLWIYPDTVETTTYDTNGQNPMVSQLITIYADTSHRQPTEVSELMSDNTVRRMKFRYPADFANPVTPNPYNGLLAENRKAIPVSTSKFYGSTEVESVKTLYNTFGSVIEPELMKYTQNGEGDAASQDFVRFHSYDSDGRLLTQSHAGGPKVSYLYGYGKTRVIAEVRNAADNEFFHENFEELTGMATSTPHTGDKYYPGDYYLSWAIPPGGRKYKLTYWYLDSGTWKFKQQAYTGPATLTLGSAIDDVSVYPEDAQIKTLTFNASGLQSSSTDEKGMVIYYEYDSQQRLKIVRDQEKNIVKQYEYVFTGPAN